MHHTPPQKPYSLFFFCIARLISFFPQNSFKTTTKHLLLQLGSLRIPVLTLISTVNKFKHEIHDYFITECLLKVRRITVSTVG